ncbi:hypothetical protein [Sphingomonas yabuuchiae]|uniref:Uncharacterized protein n=1 Tax=Sphingomonas yabuuchiae TaxID=172044 RepID=A0ABR6K743_9SPHN|nr:hypothetical protein [Sphingomonas yabuuchiae]MBB4608899.1 hypothetical protein [Sphingomonas yabuuchiae]
MSPPPHRRPVYQKATLRLSAGRVVDLRLKLNLTSGGLLAIGGLVSSILLSTAVLVGVATRHLPRRDRP